MPLPVIGVEAIGKRFGGVVALDDVTVDIAPGSVHALVGENGAGKSTLGKIIGGVLGPDTGTLLVNGKRTRYRGPRNALADGIAVISQELALVPARSVAENVFLNAGHTPTRSGLLRRYAALEERIGFGIPGSATVGSLRLADQQKVEIMRALARDTRVIVMDEPTAVLNAEESEALREVVRGLREAGTTVVYVSHFLEEVLAVSDTVTILRNGRLVRTGPTTAETTTSLVSGMIGQPLDTAIPPKPEVAPDAPERIRVSGLTSSRRFTDVSFVVRRGEILGIAGVVGSGRSEIARALVGADRPTAGTISIDGEAVDVTNPARACRNGLVMVPESRKTQGLVLEHDVTANVVIPRLGQLGRLGFSRARTLSGAARQAVELAGAPSDRLRERVGTLSGGNQQKVLFAKWLATRPRALIADEPTQGVDVAAKKAIYRMMFDLVAEGMSIVLISSDLDELLGLSHRVLVLRRGEVVGELSGERMDRVNVMRLALASGDGEGEARV